jgi:hypothetical protein
MRFNFIHKGYTGPPSGTANDQPFGADVEGEHKSPTEQETKDLYTSDGESISSGQDGVKKAQATTIVWSRKALITAYGL